MGPKGRKETCKQQFKYDDQPFLLIDEYTKTMSQTTSNAISRKKKLSINVYGKQFVKHRNKYVKQSVLFFFLNFCFAINLSKSK